MVTFPEACPWLIEQGLDAAFLPEGLETRRESSHSNHRPLIASDIGVNETNVAVGKIEEEVRSQEVDFIPQQIFHREVERQCKFALMAYEDLKQALAILQQCPERPPSPATVNFADVAQMEAFWARHAQWGEAFAKHQQMQEAANDRLWYAVQAFLVAAGNISKLLWPTYWKGENQLPGRGCDLIVNLKVEENSPLAPRTFRNHFEHFDVRLEEWAVSSKHRGFIDTTIGSIYIGPGAEPGDCLRNFDPENFAVTFRGDSYHLLPIVEAIEQLWHKAIVQLKQRAST